MLRFIISLFNKQPLLPGRTLMGCNYGSYDYKQMIVKEWIYAKDKGDYAWADGLFLVMVRMHLEEIAKIHNLYCTCILKPDETQYTEMALAIECFKGIDWGRHCFAFYQNDNPIIDYSYYKEQYT